MGALAHAPRHSTSSSEKSPSLLVPPSSMSCGVYKGKKRVRGARGARAAVSREQLIAPYSVITRQPQQGSTGRVRTAARGVRLRSLRPLRTFPNFPRSSALKAGCGRGRACLYQVAHDCLLDVLRAAHHARCRPAQLDEVLAPAHERETEQRREVVCDEGADNGLHATPRGHGFGLPPEHHSRHANGHKARPTRQGEIDRQICFSPLLRALLAACTRSSAVRRSYRFSRLNMV